MTDFYSVSSTISPFTAILWCLYPIAVLVIIELLLGGGFDDDNNDDQDGGMLIPAYSRSNTWNNIEFQITSSERSKVDWLTILIQLLFPYLHLPFLSFQLCLGLCWEPLKKVERLYQKLTRIDSK